MLQTSYSACNNDLTRYPVSFNKNFEGTPATNAGFDIYASPYTASSVSLGHDTLANDGWVRVTGLLPGSYVIKETTTPAGYGTMSDINNAIAANGDVTGLPTAPVDNDLTRYPVSLNKQL